MKTRVSETISNIEQRAMQGMQHVPGLRRVFGQTVYEGEAAKPESFSNNVGNIALVGDFGFVRDDKTRTAIASYAVRVLQEHGVVEAGSSVDIRTLIPDISKGDNDKSLDAAAFSLARVLDETSNADQYLHYDPITVTVDDGDRKTVRRNIHAGIREVAPGRLGEAFGEKLVVVVNPFFLSQALPNLAYSNMNRGGVAVLMQTGESPDADRFAQVWSAPPDPGSRV